MVKNYAGTARRAPTALVISGPTASGKSALALKIAEECDVVIINADALQLYEGLPILSSQPTAGEQKKTKHLLYSHFKSHESCSVATWLKLLRATIDATLQQNKLPLIVGGSGMYISKIFDGISMIPEISEQIRIEARQLFEEIGKEEFQQKLIDLGEDEILDKQRLIRAYEVLLQTGKPLFWWHQQPKKNLFVDVDFTHVNINPNREELYRNCNLRFEKMLDAGAMEEVKELLKQGANADWQISKTLGFSEIKNFLVGEISRQKMIELATQKTRNYAKRQITWFRHQFAEKLVFENIDEAFSNLQKS